VVEVMGELKEAARATLETDPIWRAHAQAHAGFHAVVHERGPHIQSEPVSAK
jgi:hypothetical protein